MKNITLAIDEEVLRQARRYAAEHDTTVNALVREYLTQLATFEDRAAQARKELVEMAKKSKARLGPDWKWNRGKTFMQIECFLDTNVLLYAAAGRADHPSKFRRASALILKGNFGISTQVLQEFFANVTSKPVMGPMLVGEALGWIERLERQPCVLIDLPLIRTAIAISQRYRINYWDGAILAAAERLGTETLFTEDLSHGQLYGSVRVVNPFI